MRFTNWSETAGAGWTAGAAAVEAAGSSVRPHADSEKQAKVKVKDKGRIFMR